MMKEKTLTILVQWQRYMTIYKVTSEIRDVGYSGSIEASDMKKYEYIGSRDS